MKLPRRRRLERKTDYKARLGLLKSEKHRLVARKTNRYILAQIVFSEKAQDKVIVRLSSKNLIEKGWPENHSGSLKSLPAAYLTGLFLGKLAKEKNITSAIFDMGMYRNVHKSRLYAVLKGAIDAGLKIPHEAKALPSDEDLKKNEKLKSTLIKLMKI